MPIFEEEAVEQFRQQSKQDPQLGESCLDEATRRLAAAVHAGTREPARGKQSCRICGATVTGWRCFLRNGNIVYTFCIHDMAYHRDDPSRVTETDVQMALSLPYGEEDPTDRELAATNR